MHTQLYLPIIRSTFELQPQPNKLTNRPRQETHPPWLLYGNQTLRLQFEIAPDDGQNVARNMLSSV
jgi:hypothetical protein